MDIVLHTCCKISHPNVESLTKANHTHTHTHMALMHRAHSLRLNSVNANRGQTLAVRHWDNNNIQESISQLLWMDCFILSTRCGAEAVHSHTNAQWQDIRLRKCMRLFFRERVLSSWTHTIPHALYTTRVHEYFRAIRTKTTAYGQVRGIFWTFNVCKCRSTAGCSVRARTIKYLSWTPA